MRSAAVIGSSFVLGLGGGLRLLGFGRGGQLAALVEDEGERRRAAAERDERQHRNARQQRHHQHHRARHAERLRIAGELLEQRLVGGAGDAGLRTSRPAAVETISAGIWVTRPSPTVRRV